MSKPIIICVDDEAIILDSLRNILFQEFGNNYNIEIAESGEEALEIFEDEKRNGNDIPLIISDYIMPKMKGDSLLIEIQKKDNNILKILLTGQATLDGVINCFHHAKLYRYIGKPWEKNDLLATVKEALKSYYQKIELEKTMKSIKRFVPEEFLLYLNKKDINDVNLGDNIGKEMTILFSDIRDFTSLSESMSADETLRFINSYLKRFVPIVNQNNGFVDKYIGDAIMATFDNPENAINASINMQEALFFFNEDRKKKDFIPINIGIGLNTGNLILGTVGIENRMQTTAIGDTVNVASRVEGLTKFLGAQIIISETVINKVSSPEKFYKRILGRIRVKGKNEPIQIFEILSGLSEKDLDLKLKTKEQFEFAIFQYVLKEIETAKKSFEELLSINPNDKAVIFYFEKCKELIKNGIPDMWWGITDLREK